MAVVREEIKDLCARSMTQDEARACVQRINRGIATIRQDLLDLYEREGWCALGYSNWRDCAIAEFNFNQSQVYRLLDTATSERNINSNQSLSDNSSNGCEVSTIVEKPAPIPERQLRPLTQLETPEEQQEAFPCVRVAKSYWPGFLKSPRHAHIQAGLKARHIALEFVVFLHVKSPPAKSGAYRVSASKAPIKP